MGSRIDLTGQNFGRWTVLGITDKRTKDGNVFWSVLCVCGNKKKVDSHTLRRGGSRSCGCLNDEKRREEKPFKNLMGRKFGRLKVIGLVIGRTKKGGRIWLCQCDCGNSKKISSNSLIGGGTTSCRCYHRDLMTTHGMSGSRFHSIWNGIVSRTTKKNEKAWPAYGGRGIKNLWPDFSSFKEEMLESYNEHVAEFGEKNTSIERNDVNGNYCKENCRWATPKEQGRNTRKNKWYLYKGKKFLIIDLVKILGVNQNTLYARLNRSNYYKGVIEPYVRA